MFRCPQGVEFEGGMCDFSENAFQAAKTLDASERERFQRAGAFGQDPFRAKKEGGRHGSLSLRSDWEDVKVHAMMSFVRSKFLQACQASRGSWWPQAIASSLRAYQLMRNSGAQEKTGDGRSELGKLLM